MASKNQLLGSGRVHEEKITKRIEIDEKLGWPKRLYHVSYSAGKVFQTLPEQNEMKELGWVESPADVGEAVEVEEVEEVEEVDSINEAIPDMTGSGNELVDLIKETTEKKQDTTSKIDVSDEK